jgi:hypothetical protein
MGMRPHVALALLMFLGGCTPSYEILKSVESDDGVYITFPVGSHLYEGEIFRIVGPVQPDAHGRLRPVLGRVRVLQVTGDTLAFVRVLEGTVTSGVSAEKVE